MILAPRDKPLPPSHPQSAGSEPGAPGGCGDLPQPTEKEIDELASHHISGTPSLSLSPPAPAGLPQPPPEGQAWALTIQDPSPHPDLLAWEGLLLASGMAHDSSSPSGQERSAFVGCFFFSPDKEGGPRALVCHPTHALMGADESLNHTRKFFHVNGLRVNLFSAL